MARTALIVLALSCGMLLHAQTGQLPPKPFKIEVVDEETGWPVPMVILKTTNHVEFVTDNAGVIAFDMPGMFGRDVWFTISADGYDVPTDGLGSRGVRLETAPGGSRTITLKRTMIAKRLGRITGEGLFDQSQKLGEHLDWRGSGVMGQDTAYEISFKDKRFWIWGDTNVPDYPLGLFETTGATSASRPIEKFEPPIALEFDYFRDDQGRVRNICRMEGAGPTWVSGLVALPDRDGVPHLVCKYSKITGDGSMAPYEIGLAEWNERTGNFEPVRTVWRKDSGKRIDSVLNPNGHPMRWKDSSGRLWLYMGDGLPDFKCPATYEAWKDPDTWRKVDQPQRLNSADGGEVSVASGAVTWNPYREKYVAIVQEGAGGFGNVWYAEAQTPEGPWGPAVKVLTHEKMTFYNPLQHADMVPPDANFLLFEGTYTKTFTSEPPTPYYEYNQILYRLDLDDPALEPARMK